MGTKLEELVTAALQLGVEERAQLAGRLLLPLKSAKTLKLIISPHNS
jgi:hypothetical protein